MTRRVIVDGARQISPNIKTHTRTYRARERERERERDIAPDSIRDHEAIGDKIKSSNMSRKNPPTSFLSFPDLRQKRVILFIPAARVESAVRAARLLDAAVKAEHAFPCFAVPPLPPFLFLFFSFFFSFFFSR